MPAKHDKPHINDALRKTLALVLAGGRGTRLKDLTDNEAKPAVHFGGKYRLIDFPLSNCVNSGIRRVGVATQYRSHNLIQHVQRGWGFFRSELNEFIQVWPAQQSDTQSWYEGTADAVFQNLDLIDNQKADYVLILGGDHIYKQDYSIMLEDHIECGADISVACVETSLEAAKEFGVMGVDAKDRIISFTEKPKNPAPIPDKPDQALASMGIYIFNAKTLRDQLLRDKELPDSSHDFGKDILPYMVKNGFHVQASRFSRSCVRESADVENYWRDVGTVDAYWEANIDLTHVTPALNLYDPSWSIWTYQVQRPAAKFVFDDSDRRGMGLDAVVSSGCVVSGSTVRRSLLFSDCRVNSYGLVEDSVILPRTDIGRHCILKKVVVAKDCKIPDGLVVGEDPVEDAKWFYRTEGGICLVTQPTLEKWARSKGK
ncbi:MAG: glucose-1-phosphate adenylyltransferase [Magnetococcales bacterium]|nr:glucose-1-phosphate adenylyltransferase [Magnetococcales bacterium]MBF0419489.1 glucose-1-phosphate adenylyltransferase [Magnetococcales bacterium]